MTDPMKRVLHLSCLALVATALLGACASRPSGPAATVNGVEISQGAVIDELQAIASNEDYATQIESSSGTKVQGSREDAFDPTFVSLVLGREIAFQIVGAEVDKRGLEVSDDVREAARQDLYSQMGQGDREAGKGIFDKFPQAYQNRLVDWNADVLVLQADLAGQPPITVDAEKEYFDTHQDEFAQVCAAHILVDTEAKANDLKAQLAAGADFATLAKANSIDTGSGAKGGELGCAGTGAYVPAFEEAAFSAPIGEVVGPVQTEFGFHLIKVSERKVPAFEDVASQVSQKLADAVSSTFSDFFQKAIGEADITVNERYGTWNADTGQVEPPASAVTSTSAPAPDPGVVPSSTSTPASP